MPVTIFTPSAALNSDDANASTSFRVIVALVAGSNGPIRVTIRTGATTLSTSHVAIGIWTGSGSNGNTVVTPAELLFGGGSGFIGLAPNTSITSDFLPNFSCTASDKLVVIVDVGAPGGNKFSSGNINVDTWFLTGGASWNQSAPTGYTLLSGIDYMVASVETSDAVVNVVASGLGASEW